MNGGRAGLFVASALALTLALAGASGCSRGCETSAGSRGTPPSASGAVPSAPIVVPSDAAVPSMHVWPAIDAGRGPAIVLLHGAAGPELFTDPTSDHRRYPEIFAAAGYTVFMPMYTEGRGGPLAAAQRALDAIATDARVDPAKIGVVGYSRGANLALRLAAADTRVAAVVEFYGWLDDDDGASLAHFPPTLILHGAKDHDVRVEKAYALDKALGAAHIDHEMYVYPDQEHGFGRKALDDSASRTLAFLGARLRVVAAPAAK